MAELSRLATTLIREMLYQNGGLPPYNEETVQRVLRQVEEHMEQMDSLMASARPEVAEEGEEAEAAGPDWSTVPEKASAVVIHHESILKLKRILLTYLKMRHDCLVRVRWEQRHLPEDVKANCSPGEIEFYRGYDRILNKYMGPGEHGVKLDLTLDIHPPKNTDVRVMVLEEHGSLALSHSAKVPLSKGSVHRIKCCEAEHLIRMGVLRVMDMNC